jgi:flotillin
MLLLVTISVSVIVLVVLLISVLSRYKRCSSDKILVIYGKVAKGHTSKCIHGGAAFVWPVIQDYSFLSLTPMQIEVDLDNALSKQNIRVSVPCNFTVGISTEPTIMANAAERLLGLAYKEQAAVAKEIIVGQLRLVVAMMDIEEINADRDKFLKSIYDNVEKELEKIGLRLINVNIKDLMDESGYLVALGKNAAADAINRAKKLVAEKNRDGLVGEAEAVRDQTIKVAQATSVSQSGQAVAQQEMRVNVANANARAVEGENTASVAVAVSTAEMRQKKAEAERAAVAAEKVKSANALQEAYKAEQDAETARAERDRATKNANEVVQAEIDKKKIEVAAEAQKNKTIKEAEGASQAVYLNMEAKARGIMEILTKQAEGLKQIVEAAGGDPDKAATLLIIDKLPQLVETQVKAISNLQIDKIVVWDNGAKGEGSTANFLSGLMGSVPPLQNLFKMAGMELPGLLGKSVEEPKSPGALK